MLRTRTFFDVDALAEEAARDWEAVEWCVVALLECARSQAARASDVTTDLPASGTLAALCVRLEPTVKALAFHSRLTIGSTIKFKDEEMCGALAKVCAIYSHMCIYQCILYSYILVCRIESLKIVVRQSLLKYDNGFCSIAIETPSPWRL